MENKDVLSFDHFLESEDKGTKKPVGKLETKENKASSNFSKTTINGNKEYLQYCSCKAVQLSEAILLYRTIGKTQRDRYSELLRTAGNQISPRISGARGTDQYY
jgi:hypothetical protein